MSIDDLLELPLALQIALGSGYIAYATAYFGARDHHSNFDKVFITLAFSMVSTFWGYMYYNFTNLITYSAQFSFTVVFAVLWRIYIRRVSVAILRKANLSWRSGEPSALETVMSNTKHYVSQVGIELIDGTWLECEQTSNFGSLPLGAVTIGKGGDVAEYVSHITKPGKSRVEAKHVLDDYYGPRISYIPANQIRRITLRHQS